MVPTEDFTAAATTNTTDYEYSYDYKDEVCNKTSVIQLGAILNPIIFSFVVILSLFGNILVIVILVRYENLKSITNAFIFNLAVSDLFFTTGLPFWAYYDMYGWTLGELLCKLVNFIFCVGYYSSGILLILMTAHRYAAVMYPLSDAVSITGCYSVLTCVAVWVVSSVVASPAFIFAEVQNQNHCVYVDSYWHLWGIYQQNILFIVSACVFVFCYSQIICRLLRPVQRRKNKTLKLIFMLMAFFFVGWAPYNVVIFLQSMRSWTKPPADSETIDLDCGSSEQLDYAFYISRLVAFMHCCLNPVFYVFVGVKFRSLLKKMLKGYSNSSSSSTRSRHSRYTITSITSGDEFSM